MVQKIKATFTGSALFAPWIEAEKAKRADLSRFQRNRRRDKNIQVKVGHGGTLDPLATGVLVVGVGNGTKELGKFLNCTKSYETTILFGAATDTYDVVGKVLSKAPFEHVTHERLQEALSQFRGRISQRPPIFSALSMDGKRLYEYAREGKALPREIQERELEVRELELLDWLDGGSHAYKWPDQLAEKEKQEAAKQLIELEQPMRTKISSVLSTGEAMQGEVESGGKRRRNSDDRDPLQDALPAAKRRERSSQPSTTDGPPTSDSQTSMDASNSSISNLPQPNTTDPPTQPPAARLRMSVSSGFYVRSLCHDLGRTVESLGIMCDLVRTRQADFVLGKNVLEYEDLQKSEDHWAPKVQHMLQNWHKSVKERGHVGSDTEELGAEKSIEKNSQVNKVPDAPP